MLKTKKTIKKIVINALLIALTAITTIFVSIPIGNQGGYFNIGDTIIIISSILFGPLSGMIVGGVGSMIADFFVAPHYSIFTLFIKGFEGLIIGLLYKKFKFKMLVSILIGLASMVVNYYFVGVFMYQSFYSPLIDTLFNFIQMVISFILSIIILNCISNIKKIKIEL